MSIVVNGNQIKRVSVGSSRMVSVWEGNSLKFPNGLIRNNGPVSTYYTRNNIRQKCLASLESAQLGSSAYISASVLPANYSALRGFYCHKSGYYSIRYKTTIRSDSGQGVYFNIEFYSLIYNAGIGAYDDDVLQYQSPQYFVSTPNTIEIDWDGDGLSFLLTAGTWYTFGNGLLSTTTEFNTSASIVYLG